ncbi:SET domain-containing protein 3 [Hypsizygus marmoreus]|uniref:SET domain-containing protein 3 n=1 Tax=Hypsizygus marmoreus TaxID=39966 RepID=A0A369JC39_HYPMA|nr:SET domain-containing protein 3 [Hypsizygus marmoreus]
MNNDAQEAAMGLLSLSPNNVPLPPPLVPQKRKHPHRDQPHQPHQQGGLKKRSSSKLVHQQRQEKEKDQELQVEVEHGQEQGQVEGDIPSESISCICGSTYDDGFSIACDDCLRWCHGACFGIASAAEAPDEWRCWVCDPREVDREGAAKLQRARREELLRLERERTQQQHQHQQISQPSHHPHRRRTSPGVDRKQRRTSATAVDNINNGGNGHKRKRRGSMVAPPAVVEDDVDVVVDIDEPWSHSYVHITEDVVPTVSTREKLQRHAQNWRGITAIDPFPPPPVVVHPLPDSACVRPPAYAVHTTAPIPSEAIITPFTSTITPSSEYLADPLNAYAHLGMPKPFVHLVGPPLDLALDARIAGDSARFVRSGCRPNAVLRPVLCRKGSRGLGRQDMETMEADSAAKASSSSTEDSEPGTLTFAVFALRDLKAHEEVVLGWEWDDGNAVHELPALIKTPDMFPHQLTSNPLSRPAKHAHLRAQMSNILHLLSSTFTTCACGAHARDCALAQMERFVDGNLDWDRARGWARGREDEAEGEAVDLGPLLGRMRGFRTKERVRGSGGLTGVEMDVREERSFGVDDGRDGDVVMGEGDEEETEDELELDAWRRDDHRATRPGKPKTKPISSRRHTNPHIQQRHTRTQLRPLDPDPGPDVTPREEMEEKMPPKMRKRWIQREKEVLRETFGGREGSNLAGSGSGDVEMHDVSTSSGEGAFVDRKLGEQVEPSVERTVHTVASPPDAEHASESDSSPYPRSSSTPSTSISLPTTTSLTSIRTHLLSLPPPTASPSASFARLSLASPSVSSDSLMFGMGLRRPSTTVVVGSPQVLQGTESLARKVGSGIGLGIGHGRKLAHLNASSVVVENNPVASASETSVRTRLESTPPVDSEATMVVDDSPESRTFFKNPSQKVEASPPPPTAEPVPEEMISEASHPTHMSPSPPPPHEPLDYHPSASPSRRAPSPPPTLVDESTTDLASTSALQPPPASPPDPQTRPTDHPDFRWASPEPRRPWVPDAASTAFTYGMSLSAPTPLPPPSQLTVGMILPASTPLPPPPSPPLSPSSLPADHPFRWRSHSPGRATTIWGTPPHLANPPPPREPTPPPPPPPPKVKMSLKDFAMRKKKQREEEERASASIEPRSVGGGSAEASPMVGTIGLAAEGSDGRMGIGDEEVKGKVNEAGSTKMGGDESRPGAGESLEVEMGDVQARRLGESVSGTEKVLRDLEHERVNDILVAEQSHPPSSEDVLADPVALVHSTRIKDEDVEMAGVIHSAIAVNSLSSTAAAKPFTASTLPFSLPVNPTYYVATLQAKTELIEQPLLSATTTEREYRPSPGPSKSNGGPPHARPPLKPPARRASSPSPSIVTQSSHPPSQEDGEITSTASSPPPPRNISPVNIRKTYIPHSHTPPTQPRSFQMAPSSSSPPPPPSRRPSIPLYRSPAPPSTTLPAALRLPPSGPRALRMGNNTFPTQRPGYPSRSLPLGPSAITNDWDSRRVPLGPSANRESTEPNRGRSTPTTPRQQQPLPAAVPRGPSADRDKLDLEHERSWSPRPRARAGGGAGWGR